MEALAYNPGGGYPIPYMVQRVKSITTRWKSSAGGSVNSGPSEEVIENGGANFFLPLIDELDSLGITEKDGEPVVALEWITEIKANAEELIGFTTQTKDENNAVVNDAFDSGIDSAGDVVTDVVGTGGEWYTTIITFQYGLREEE